MLDIFELIPPSSSGKFLYPPGSTATPLSIDFLTVPMFSPSSDKFHPGPGRAPVSFGQTVQYDKRVLAANVSLVCHTNFKWASGPCFLVSSLCRYLNKVHTPHSQSCRTKPVKKSTTQPENLLILINTMDNIDVDDFMPICEYGRNMPLCGICSD